MGGVQLKAEFAAQNLVAQQAGGTRFFERRLEAVVGLEDFAVNVVVADRNAHRVGGDDHALDDNVRIELQDVAVFAGTGLPLVGIAHQVLLARKLAWHEAPLEPGRKTGTAAPAQGGLFDRCDHLVLRQTFATVLAQNLAQRLIAPARFVILQVPVRTVQVRHDLGVDMPVVKAGLHAGGLKLGKYLFSQHHLSPAARKPSTN